MPLTFAQSRQTGAEGECYTASMWRTINLGIVGSFFGVDGYVLGNFPLAAMTIIFPFGFLLPGVALGFIVPLFITALIGVYIGWLVNNKWRIEDDLPAIVVTGLVSGFLGIVVGFVTRYVFQRVL